MHALRSLLQALRSPGAKFEMQSAAPTQLVPVAGDEQSTPQENVSGYTVKIKPRLLDRWLDKTVQFAGSPFVFLLITALLIVWALLGIPYHNDVNWQVLISDVQAIVSYIFDSFLMRQQLNGYEQSIRITVELRSRGASHQRMLESIMTDLGKRGIIKTLATVDEKDREKNVPPLEFDAHLPKEKWFGRLSSVFSKVMGHLAFITIYWVGIFIWIGFGHYCGWSNMWQLYINSATSALMLFVFSFLANIYERHSDYEEKSLDAIYKVDSALETKLRVMTGDNIPNQVIVSLPRKVNPLQRAIDYYAEVVGTLMGILLLCIVIVVWLVIGPAMGFDSNWWLIIGTYAGLIGMNDGFVLRNVQSKMREHEDEEFTLVDVEEAKLFNTLSLALPEEIVVKPLGFSHRASAVMNRVCAHEVTVLTGVLVIIGLIIGASVMKWNLTGQLLCNVPPSLIETFFMIILITGHNLSDARKRVDLQNIYRRRLELLVFVKRLEMAVGSEVA